MGLCPAPLTLSDARLVFCLLLAKSCFHRSSLLAAFLFHVCIQFRCLSVCLPIHPEPYTNGEKSSARAFGHLPERRGFSHRFCLGRLGHGSTSALILRVQPLFGVTTCHLVLCYTPSHPVIHCPAQSSGAPGSAGTLLPALVLICSQGQPLLTTLHTPACKRILSTC